MILILCFMSLRHVVYICISFHRKSMPFNEYLEESIAYISLMGTTELPPPAGSPSARMLLFHSSSLHGPMFFVDFLCFLFVFAISIVV